MSILLTSPQTKTCPVGTHHAVLKDAEDLGTVETRFGNKEQVRLEWEVSVDGETFMVKGRYTRTLHPKGNLSRDLTSWIGRDPRPSFELETMIGKPAMLLIVHHQDDQGQTWARVQSVLPSDVQPAAIGDPPASSKHSLPF